MTVLEYCATVLTTMRLDGSKSRDVGLMQFFQYNDQGGEDKGEEHHGQYENHSFRPDGFYRHERILEDGESRCVFLYFRLGVLCLGEHGIIGVELQLHVVFQLVAFRDICL